MTSKKVAAGLFLIVLILFFAGAAEPQAEASAEEEAAQNEEAGDAYTLSDSDIRDFHLQILKDGEWVSPGEPVEISRNDEVRFVVDYSIPAGALNSGVNTVTYKLPDAISTFTGSGEVKSGDETIGSYAIKDGVVTIAFSKAFVEKEGAFGIVGSFDVTGKASQIKEDGTGDGADILFNGNKKLHITFKSDNPDISAKKTGEAGPDGTFTYKVVVESQNGTNDPVVVKDELTGASLVEGSVAVVNQDGEAVTPEVSEEDGGFSITLPKMAPGSTDTITYKAKLPDDYSGARTTVENQASATSGDLKSDTEPVRQDYGVTMKKTGEIRGDEAVWTITIENEGGMDLSGMSLEDLLKKDGADAGITGEAYLSADGGDEEPVTLPYTFPEGSTAKTYRIEVVSSALQGKAAYDLHNEASLKKPGKAPITAKADLHVDKEPDFGVGKAGTGVLADGNTLTLDWAVTLAANTEKKAPFTVRDELGDGSHMSPEEIAQVRAELESQIGTGNFDLETLPEGASKDFTGFEITFKKDLPAGSAVELTYQSTAQKPSDEVDKVFTNRIRTGDTVVEAENTYTAHVVIEKEGVGTWLDRLGEHVVLNWHVKLHTDSDQGFSSPYTLEDLFDAGQWMTDDQFGALAEKLKEAFGEGNYTLQKVENAGKITGFRVQVDTPLVKGKEVVLQFEDTADLPKDQTTTFENTADIINGPKSTGKNTFTYPEQKPLVEKCDMDRGDTTKSPTYHTVDEIGGQLKWLVRVYPTQEQKDGSITIREVLPEGATLDNLVLRLPDPVGELWSHELFKDGKLYDTVNYRHKDYQIGLKQDGRILTVTLPEDLIPKGYNQMIGLEVYLKIDEPFDGALNAEHTKRIKAFENQVSVLYQGNPVGQASQTQQISQETHSGYLEKAGTQKEIGDGVDELTYTINVNPKAEELVYGKTDISVEDTLSYDYTQESQMIAYLEPSSLKVEYKDASGNYVPLPESKWSYTTETKTPSYGDYEKGNHCYEKIRFIFPDNTAIRVTYTYRLSGIPGASGNVDNSVSLSGYSKAASSSMKPTIAKITGTASAQASVAYIKKVDQNNNQVTLDGATFKIYMYDPDSDAPDHFVACDTVTTKEQKVLTPEMQVLTQDGIAVLTPINFNTAYKIVETQAPEGYALDSTPYYFYIPSSNTQDWPMTMPGSTDIQIHPVNSLCEITITNAKKLSLPEAGGSGQMLALTTGFVLLAGTGLSLFRKIRIK